MADPSHPSLAEAVAEVNAGGGDMIAALELLEVLTRRPAWHARARCRGYGPGAFFSGDTGAARATCQGCPVRAECREAGEAEPGVWGGLSERERRRLRRQAG